MTWLVRSSLLPSVMEAKSTAVVAKPIMAAAVAATTIALTHVLMIIVISILTRIHTGTAIAMDTVILATMHTLTGRHRRT